MPLGELSGRPRQPSTSVARSPVAGSRAAMRVSVSVDPPAVSAAFRAGLGARWTFLCDADHRAVDDLGLRETTDTLNDPFVPAVFVLAPGLRVHSAYNGYWFWGRPTAAELVADLRAVTRAIRSDWDAPTPSA